MKNIFGDNIFFFNSNIDFKWWMSFSNYVSMNT